MYLIMPVEVPLDRFPCCYSLVKGTFVFNILNLPGNLADFCGRLISIIGACTLLLSLLVGISTQLIIQYPTKVVLDPRIATIPTGVNYMNYDNGVVQHSMLTKSAPIQSKYMLMLYRRTAHVTNDASILQWIAEFEYH